MTNTFKYCEGDKCLSVTGKTADILSALAVIAMIAIVIYQATRAIQSIQKVVAAF